MPSPIVDSSPSTPSSSQPSTSLAIVISGSVKEWISERTNIVTKAGILSFATNYEKRVVLPLMDTGTAKVVMIMCPPAAVAANISAVWPSTVNVSGRVRPLRSHATVVPASAGADFTDQWLRMEACWRAARAYEHSHMALGFTHVLRARPELRWYRSIQPLASFHPHKVSLKARSLTYPTPRKVPEAAFSSSFHCDPFFVYDGRHHGDVPVAYFGSRPWSSVSFKEIQGLRSVGSRNQTQVEEHLAPIRRAIRRSGIPYATRAHSLPPSSRLPLVPSRADPHWP